MEIIEGIYSAPTAFVAGLVVSLHCAGMCGPLACAFHPRPGEATSPYVAHSLYHGARLFSYAVLGALAGWLGTMPSLFLPGTIAVYLPWVLVGFFLVVALGLDRFVPKPKFLSRLFFRAKLRAGQLPASTKGLGLGLLTPFLPCGPLYLVFGVALFTGSALRGAEFLLAFGLGTVPLLWLVQSRFGWLQRRLGPVWTGRLQRGVALAAALVIAWRLRDTYGLIGPLTDPNLCH